MTLPFPLQTEIPSVVTPYTQILVTDIDGDTTNEVIMLDANLGQLSVCHQFAYSDISLNQISSIWSSTQPIWSDTNFQWITAWGVPPGGIPVPQNATFAPWVVTPGDVIMAADLDGDGTDELFIYNLISLNWGVLKWQSNQLQTICNQPAAPATGGGPNAVTWQGSTNDQYFVIPTVSAILPSVTANSDGILLYNSQTFSMGMISYSTGKFSQWWSNTGNTLPGNWRLNQANSPYPATNKFYPGYFVTAGVPSIAVYNPSDQYITLLEWNAQNKVFQAQPGQGHQVGQWSFGWTDELQVADLDGDGLGEIFIYSAGAGGTTDIGILKWVSGSFQQRALRGGTFGTQPPHQWTTGQQDTYLCLNSPGGGLPGMIYCFSPGIPGNSSHVPQVGMLHYSDKDFAVAWAGPSLLPNNAWPVTAADTIYAGPAWDIRMPNLITLSNQGSTPAFTLGAAGWTGTAVQIVSIQTVPVPAWSPAGLANNAPYTPFGAFQNPDQQTIYTYLSQLFPAPGQTGPGPTTDVRSQYAINSNTTIWQNYGAAINAVQNPSQIPSSWLAPPPNNWTTLDWTTVVGTLFNECEEVVTIYSQYGNLVSSVEALWVYETQDIVIAGTSTQETGQDNPSPRNYWLGQIFVTGLWNFAANAGSFFPDSPMNAAAFRLFVSTLASLAGSGISYNPTQQPSMTVSNAYPLIINTSGKTIVNNSLNLSAIFRDPVKMSILSGLAANEWQFVSAFPTSMEQPFKTVDQVWMYQQLVPFYFSIQVYGPGTRLPSSGATYTLNNIGYVLQNQSGPFSASQFQATELYRILISTLGVNQKDFFLGNGGWAVIPRQIMT